MNNSCFKMPPLIKIDNFNDDWESYLNYIYKLYIEDFFNNTVYYKSLPIKTFTELEYNGRQVTFNHLTTKGSKDRLYNTMRCERYKWIKEIIKMESCSECDDIAVWQEEKKKKKRVIIWCRKSNFVIILERRKSEYYLITAYCVIYPNTERDLRNSYNNYKAKNQRRLSQ